MEKRVIGEENRKRIKTILSIIVGNALYALSVKLFLLNSGLVTGGTTGISLVLNKLLGIPVSGFILIFNVLMLLLGWAVLGGRFALTTVASTFLYPVFLEIFSRIVGDRVLTNDIVLCTVFSGFGMGIALGIVIREGASTGGMDIPTLVLKKLYNVPLAVSFYVFDFIILAAQGLFAPARMVMYGVINVIVYTIMMDKMLILGNSKTEVKIISDKTDELRKTIITLIDRGVTMIESKGGYTGNDREMILSVISNRELPYMEKIIQQIDPECFIIISRVTQVKGNGFTMNKDILKKEQQLAKKGLS